MGDDGKSSMRDIDANEVINPAHPQPQTLYPVNFVRGKSGDFRPFDSHCAFLR